MRDELKLIRPSLKWMSLWIALFLGLYLICAGLIRFNSNSNTELDLLNERSQFVYGHSVFDNTNLSFKLDEFGETALFFQTSLLDAALLETLQVEVTGLNNNYQIDLVWKNQNQPNTFEQRLLHANGRVQTNLIMNHPDWGKKIEQIGIRVRPQEHLGLILTSEDVITLKTLRFMPLTYVDSLGLIKDYWFEYDAWSYKSINHNKFNKILPIYAQPHVFIVIWLFMACLSHWLLFNNKMYVVLILFSWLWLDLFFLSDMRSRSVWVQQFYPSTRDAILPDENLNQLAKQVKSLLNLDQKQNNTKILILSTNRYQRARLIYHMLPVNSSFLDLNAEAARKSKVNIGDYILSFDAARNPMRPTSGKLRYNENSMAVKEVAHGPEYSLMKVIHD